MEYKLPVIVDSSDGKYHLNEKVLISIASEAKDCQNFALISTFGSNQNLLVNCFANYLNSGGSDDWSSKTFASETQLYDENVLLRMGSKLHIIVDGITQQKTAVFLMAGNGSSHKLFELLFRTSSAVIFGKENSIQESDIKMTYECLKEMTENFTSDCLQKVFHLVFDWDPNRKEFKNKNYFFGLNGGNRYTANEFKTLQTDESFKRYLNEIKCFLLPSVEGKDTQNPDNNQMTKAFVAQFSRLMSEHLFGELALKKDQDQITCLKPDQLISLFRETIDKINSKTYPDINLTQSLISCNVPQKESNGGIEGKSTLSPLLKTSIIKSKNFDSKKSTPDVIKESLQLDINEQVSGNLADFDGSKYQVMSEENGNNSKQNEVSINQKSDNFPELNKPVKQYSFVKSSEQIRGGVGVSTLPTKYKKNSQSLEKSFKEIKSEIFSMKHQFIPELQEYKTSKPIDSSTIFENFNLGHHSVSPKLSESVTANINEFSKICSNISDPIEGSERQMSPVESKSEETINCQKSQTLNNLVQLNSSALDSDKMMTDNLQEHLNRFDKKFPSEGLEDCQPKEIMKTKDKVSNESQIFDQKYAKIVSESIESYERLMCDTIDQRLQDHYEDLALLEIHNNICKKIETSFEKQVLTVIPSDYNLKKSSELKLKKALHSKKSKFESGLAQIKQYRQSWIKQLKESRYMSAEVMKRCNPLKTIKSGDQRLDQIIDRLINKSFEEFFRKNNKIKNQEMMIESRATELILSSITTPFESKLRSNFFIKIQFNEMSEKLMKYCFDCFDERLDLNENQKKLSEDCIKRFESELKKLFSLLFAKHSQKSLEVKQLMKQSIDTSVEYFREEIQTLIDSGDNLDKENFNLKKFQLKKEASSRGLKTLRQIEPNLNHDFYQKLFDENKGKINQKLNECEEEFNDLLGKTASKDLSVAIYFGRHHIYCLPIEQGHRSAQDTLKMSNCVAVKDKVLLGQDAVQYYEKMNMHNLMNFDIKSLLGKEAIDNREKQFIPFSVNNNVKLSNGLRIESLMAMQLKDIKSVIEKQLKGVVTTGVFTVPSHYTTKQKSALKDVSLIAGFKTVEILSEISAAAISYAMDTNFQQKTVLFVAINENKCDSAVCQIRDNRIEYKTQFTDELTEEEMTSIRRGSRSRYYQGTLTNIFGKIIGKNMSKGLYQGLKSWFTGQALDVDNVVVIGSSDLIEDMKTYIRNGLNFYRIHEYEPSLLVRGTASYGQRKYELVQSDTATNLSSYSLGLTKEEIDKQKLLVKTISNKKLNPKTLATGARASAPVPTPRARTLKLAIDSNEKRLREELKTCYKRLENRIKSTELRPTLKENIEQQMSETLELINSGVTDSKTLESHKVILDKIFERIN